MARFVSRHSPYASTPKQWGYFKALTGHELPRGCSKSEASRLIGQAKAGTWKPALRTIEVGAYRVTDWTMKPGPVAWDVSVNHHPQGPRFDSAEAARAYAETLVRDGETVVVRTGCREILVD